MANVQISIFLINSDILSVFNSIIEPNISLDAANEYHFSVK